MNRMKFSFGRFSLPMNRLRSAAGSKTSRSASQHSGLLRLAPLFPTLSCAPLGSWSQCMICESSEFSMNRGGGTRRVAPCSAACSGATSVLGRCSVYVPPALHGQGRRSPPCSTMPWFMGSPLSIFFRTHWDHEPSIPRSSHGSAVASPRDTAFGRRWTFKCRLTLRSGPSPESGVTATALQDGKRVLTNLPVLDCLWKVSMVRGSCIEIMNLEACDRPRSDDLPIWKPALRAGSQRDN